MPIWSEQSRLNLLFEFRFHPPTIVSDPLTRRPNRRYAIRFSGEKFYPNVDVSNFRELLQTMGRIERSRELASKRARKAKLKKLRAKYAAASNETEKQAIREKVIRVSPFAVLED